ncbi:MAG: hypothetical protein MUE41_08210 [Gemmatimonadaceae bacterium]|jgi:hypothetical protein|nr:hypothetical protein [Gemmatimonadaceae bacterium]
MYRCSPATERKLRVIARELHATILTPFYPVSDLLRMARDNGSVQLDFMAKLNGIREYASRRARASTPRIGAHELRVAALDDSVRSTRAAGRPQDLAVLLILRLLAVPMHKRVHVLRVRQPGGGSPI